VSCGNREWEQGTHRSCKCLEDSQVPQRLKCCSVRKNKYGSASEIVFPGILDQIFEVSLSENPYVQTDKRWRFDISMFWESNICQICVRHVCHDVCGVCGKDRQVGHGVRGGHFEGEREKGGKQRSHDVNLSCNNRLLAGESQKYPTPLNIYHQSLMVLQFHQYLVFSSCSVHDQFVQHLISMVRILTKTPFWLSKPKRTLWSALPWCVPV